MQSELVNELLQSLNAHLLTLVFQFVIVGLVLLSVKDFSAKILSFIQVKWSDLGRGTRVEIGGKIGDIERIGFSEIEIKLDKDKTLLIPTSNFIKANKVIITRTK